jgi:acetyltransferase-like isoleucine patch superfamily enzyme
MQRLDARMRPLLRRLEREAVLWREEPLRRVWYRNRLINPLRQRQFHSFGPNALVDRPQWLYGTEHIAIGKDVTILRGAWLAVERPAWGRTDPVIELHDNVGIRPGCTLSAAESIVVEEHVGMGAFVTIIDSQHTWRPDHPNPLRGPLKSAPVRIGRGTWLADRVTVAAGADIGEQCAIGPNSTVSGTVPDYSLVLGNPGRVVGSTRG